VDKVNWMNYGKDLEATSPAYCTVHSGTYRASHHEAYI